MAETASFHDAMISNMRGNSEALVPYLREASDVGRARVYQNNMLSALGQSLVDNYPAVARLVGDEFMRALARAFAETHPSSSPLMTAYGREFASFIDGFPPTQSLPYLGDVARHDWAFIEALFASDEAPMAASALQGLDDAQIAALAPGLHPSVRTLKSKWNAYEIWASNRDEQASTKLALKEAPSHALIWRGPSGITHRAIAAPVAVFLRAIDDGQTLGAAQEIAPEPETIIFFADALRLGVFGAIDKTR